MVEPVPFSNNQLDRMIEKNKKIVAKKLARKPNSNNEKHDGELNRQAHRETVLPQNTSVGKNTKKLDVSC